jgi:hypothetical protein
MATMIPGQVEQFTTEGEKKVYHFFEKVAVPHAKYQVWYTPDIDGNEPDFILFCNRIGLIIFEVKDWDIYQIIKATQQQFTLKMGSKLKKRKNPLKQAKGYLYNLLDKFENDGKLISDDPLYKGKPSIPIDYGVIFPNINSFDFQKKDLDSVITAEKILFWDDLHPQSDLCCDDSGQLFIELLETRFKPRFSFDLKFLDLKHLKQLIFPTVKIELPQRSDDGNYLKQIRRLKTLDNNQESIARKYDGGHRIITGPSGTGKTLILAHKAAFLKKYNPKINNILFVCFNITLVQYIKRLLAAKSVPMGSNGVTVVHIYELCSKIINEDVNYEGEDADYYDLIIQEALVKAKEADQKYDAILVDEGQDMSDDMIRIIVNLLNKKINNLTIARDENQNIYQHKRSWKDVGVQARGRTHKLIHVYRSTKQLNNFASTFLNEISKEEDQQLDLFPDFDILTGPKPEIKQFCNYQEIMIYLIAKLELIRKKGFPLSESAVIYPMKSPKQDPDIVIPKKVEKHLDDNGILHNWASKNYHSKKAYDITTNSITISTIHSVKGFDYSNVFLLGMDFIEPGRWTENQINRLVYVAITRARHRLFIPYIIETALIKQLKDCL